MTKLLFIPDFITKAFFITNYIDIHSLDPLDSQIVASTIIQTNNQNAIYGDYNYKIKRIAGFTITNSNYGLAQIQNCLMEYNKVINNNYDGLSGCDNSTIQDCTISGNNSAGLNYCDNSTIQDCTISGNNNYGINRCDNSTIQDCTISGNNNYGINRCDNSTIQNCTISGNNNHGLYQCHNSTNLNNKINNNITGISGSYNCIFIGNQICSNTYSGIESGSGLIQDNYIAYNKSYGIVGNLSQTIVERNKIIHNNASGIFLENPSATAIIRNNLIANNSGENGGGICIIDSSSPYSYPSIANNTIINNFASGSGGGVYANYDGIGIFNCIVWGNLATSDSQLTSNIITHYSCTQSGTTDNNCINSNPLFVSSKDFHLSSNSPCVEAGYNLPGIDGQKDLDGEARLQGDFVDMGCYEGEGIPEPFIQLFPLIAIGFLCRLKIC